MKLFSKIQNTVNKYSKIASNKIQPLYSKVKTFANDVGRKIEKTSGQIGNALNSDVARSVAFAVGGPEGEILRRQTANTLRAIGDRASSARDSIQKLPSNVPSIQFANH